MMRRSFALLAFPAAGYTPSNPAITHEVINQAPYFENYNAYDLWPRMKECVATYGAAGKYGAQFSDLGKKAGSAEWLEQAHIANKFEPVFTPFDRQGRRINGATLDESYHRLMDLALSSGCASNHYFDKQHGHIANTVLSMLTSMLEQGTTCPTIMTAACVPSLMTGGPFFQPYIDRMVTKGYDPRDIHISLKTAATCGMSMTEKQGGSDVRQNTSFAIPLKQEGCEENGAAYNITGHKWFTSAPMSDVFFTLAYTSDNKVSCFLIPRWISPTERNEGLRFQRLKNKMGDKSNASSEVEYNNAVGYLLGKRGEGVKTIIKMVNYTRLMCTLGSTALAAVAVSNAIHHTSYRSAFGSALVDKPLMQNVLCDMIMECEANIALTTRVARSFDDQPDLSKDYMRLAVAVAKYMACKRCTSIVHESLECHGGNGYLEDFPLARYFRQSPLNAIWEGSGNVIILDVFRTLQKDPKSLEAVLADIKATGHPALIREAEALMLDVRRTPAAELEMSGRSLVERLGIVMQGAALYHSRGDMEVYDTFVASRVGEHQCRRRVQLGTLESKQVNPAFIKRNTPIIGI